MADVVKISITGPLCSGKSTIAAVIVDALKNAGITNIKFNTKKDKDINEIYNGYNLTKLENRNVLIIEHDEANFFNINENK